jgi:hypothetical protein
MGRILTVALTASLLSAPVMADPSPAESAPRTRTEPFLRCLVGLVPAECRKSNAYPLRVQRAVRTGCTGDVPEEVNYLGVNASGADVYEVRYREADSTLVISPPGPDGKIQFQRKGGNPNGIIPSPLVGIPPHSVPVSIYVRPENLPHALCPNYSLFHVFEDFGQPITP